MKECPLHAFIMVKPKSAKPNGSIQVLRERKEVIAIKARIIVTFRCGGKWLQCLREQPCFPSDLGTGYAGIYSVINYLCSV